MIYEQKNWLHLDLKGVIPSFSKFEEHLRFFKDCGFNGIIWEIEDRIPWKNWPGTWRQGFTLEEYAKLMKLCHELELESVPLIQTMGHLDWLLRYFAYQHLRENGNGSELCPRHPETMPRLKSWIDEVVELHPGIKYIHLGADETHNMGKCERCRTHAKMDIYTSHISELCQYALSKGVRPLIWADMFLREHHEDAAKLLPEGTILVDWHYRNVAPYDSTPVLQKSGHEVMGASGIMVGYWEQCYRVQGIPAPRIENVVGWKKWAGPQNVGMIHTTWTRACSQWNLYGPWIGYLLVFMAGGTPEMWELHPWHDFMMRVSQIMANDQFDDLEKAAQDVMELPVRTPFEKASRSWWNLALRYQSMQKEFQVTREQNLIFKRSIPFVGENQDMFQEHGVKPFYKIKEKMLQWQKDVHVFWQENELSDEEEFIATRCIAILDDCDHFITAKQ